MSKLANEEFCNEEVFAKYAETHQAILQELDQPIMDLQEADVENEIRSTHQTSKVIAGPHHII